MRQFSFRITEKVLTLVLQKLQMCSCKIKCCFLSLKSLFSKGFGYWGWEVQAQHAPKREFPLLNTSSFSSEGLDLETVGPVSHRQLWENSTPSTLTFGFSIFCCLNQRANRNKDMGLKKKKNRNKHALHLIPPPSSKL